MRDQNLELNDSSARVLDSKQIRSMKKNISLAEDEDSSLLVSARNLLHIIWRTVLKEIPLILPFNAVRYTSTLNILGSIGSQFNLGQNLYCGHAEFSFLPCGYSHIHSPLEVLDIWQPTCLCQSCAFRNRTPVEQIRNKRLKCKFTKATTI